MSAWRKLPNRPPGSCDHRFGVVHRHGDKTLASGCSRFDDPDADSVSKCDQRPGTTIGYCGACGHVQMFQPGRLLTKAEREPRP